MIGRLTAFSTVSDGGDRGGVIGMGAVAEIEPEYVRAGLVQLGDRLRIPAAGGAQGCENLGPAATVTVVRIRHERLDYTRNRGVASDGCLNFSVPAHRRVSKEWLSWLQWWPRRSR